MKMLFRHRGVVYVGAPRMVERSFPGMYSSSTYNQMLQVYDPCWAYLGNHDVSETQFHDMIQGKYPYNRTWVQCGGIAIDDPDVSIPFDVAPGYLAFRLAAGLKLNGETL